MSEDQAKQFIEQASQSLQSGQVEQALSLVDQAIALNPRDTEAHMLRGVCLAQTNRPQEATDAFKQAIGLSPYSAKAYYNLAVHYYSLGQKHDALNMAQEAVSVDPRHTSAKDLVSRISGEMRSAATQTGHGVSSTPETPSNPADALAGMGQPVTPPNQSGMTPPPGVMPPTVGPTPPPNIPTPGPSPAVPPGNYERPGPYQQPASYTRPGYGTGEPAHTLSFVENLGNTWTVFAWVLFVLFLFSLGFFGVGIYQVVQESAGNPELMGSISPLYQLPYALVSLLALVWMILDLVDRKGNWVWLIAQFCCCGPFILPIYLLAGRK